MAEVESVDGVDRGTVRVRNISESGLMFEANDRWTVGEAITLTLRGVGRVTGRIVWYAEDRIGVSFDEPIDPRQTRKQVGVVARPEAPPRTRRSGLRLE